MNMTDRRGRLPDCDEFASGLEHGGDAGGIVERAVVDSVLAGLDPLLDAEVIKMARQDDMLCGELGSAPGRMPMTSGLEKSCHSLFTETLRRAGRSKPLNGFRRCGQCADPLERHWARPGTGGPPSARIKWLEP